MPSIPPTDRARPQGTGVCAAVSCLRPALRARRPVSEAGERVPAAAPGLDGTIPTARRSPVVASPHAGVRKNRLPDGAGEPRSFAGQNPQAVTGLNETGDCRVVRRHEDAPRAVSP